MKLRTIIDGLTRRADTLIALSSMLVAVVSLWISIDQMRNNNQVEKMRWRPILAWGVAKGGPDGFRVTLQNQGLGPGVIKWTQVFWGSDLAPHWDYIYSRSHEGNPSSLSENVERTFSLANPDSVLPVTGFGEYNYFLKEKHPEWESMLWRGLENISFVACYCSLFGECKIAIWSRNPAQLGASMKRHSPTCKADAIYETYFKVPPGFMK